MNTINNINTYNGIPISGKMLLQDYHNMKSPENKIQRLVKNGQFIRLKRDLYVDTSNGTIDTYLAANYIVMPSYVSGLTALSHYGIIPESVFDVISMTPMRAKEYKTPAGHFTYVTCPTDYFPIGIISENVQGHNRLIASVEKALCDHILITPNLNLRYTQEILTWMEQDMRMDTEELSKMDLSILKQCSEYGRKSTMINKIIKIYS